MHGGISLASISTKTFAARWQLWIGNCTGLQNPQVLPRVFLGYGLGYRILYPRETRTRVTGTWVGGGLLL